jgi:hypothetical protein
MIAGSSVSGSFWGGTIFAPICSARRWCSATESTPMNSCTRLRPPSGGPTNMPPFGPFSPVFTQR